MVCSTGSWGATGGGAPVAGKVRRMAGVRRDHLADGRLADALRHRGPAASARRGRPALFAGGGPGRCHAYLVDALGG